MSIQDFVVNDLIQEESSVWVLKEHGEFGYSDGAESERYLEKVLKSAADLSSGSAELERHIKDWPSEYHLTAKRAHLFAGFEFDPGLKVLEVGCGCGAVTRFLGETFRDVVSIEGSIKRARLARLRTMGLESVTIICAPFQEIGFSGKFDIIFCIGVYEYSASFVAGADPYDSVLGYFADMLTPTGIVVIAIENQFGLKYFNSAREDHTASMYEGLEGYRVNGHRVRTFGKKELESNLRKHFSSVEMYYPYPDYKLPTCVMSDEFLASPSAGELVSQIRSRDYYGETARPWDETLVSLELSRNGMLPFFSNSFLVFAGKSRAMGVSFDQLAILVSSQRAKKFRTVTRVHRDSDGGISVSKKLLSGDSSVTAGKLTLGECHSMWNDRYSLHIELYINCMSKNLELTDIFSPCELWIDYLLGNSNELNGERVLDGRFIDCIFSNVYSDADGISFVDDEWTWGEKIGLNVVVIRAIFRFISSFDDLGCPSEFKRPRGAKRLIRSVAECLGVKLESKDFSDFVEVESELQSLVTGTNRRHNKIALRWILFDRQSFFVFYKLRGSARIVGLRATRFITRIFKAAVRRVSD